MTLDFAAPPASNAAAETLRGEVRRFLATELAGRTPQERAQSWSGVDPAFSRKMGERGWLGMTWPRAYGGQERSALERYVMLEEVLAAGAPVGFHWIAERQSGPNLLRYGTEAQRRAILPGIMRGETCFCIGMSEPDSGSDLAATRTRAAKVQGGWVVNGTKLWTTGAHHADYMILFCRTGAAGGAEDRHGGVSQFVVEMQAAQRNGMTVRPVLDMRGAHHFNEVVLEDLILPDDALLGAEGDGWTQVTGELAYERSGPDRFLSSFTLLAEALRALGPDADDGAALALGRLTAHIMALRRLSRSVAGMLQAGQDPALQASVVKDLGNVLEQETVEVVRLLLDREPDEGSGDAYVAVLAQLVMTAPSFSLRGGTREILRGIIARGMGLR